MSQTSGIVRVNAIPFTAGFSWSVGILMEKFIQALAQKKLLAAKCPKCGYVYTPPRNRCGKCAGEMGEANLLELSGRGTLLSHTAAYVELDGAGNWKELAHPKFIAAVKLDGADSTLFLPLEQAEEKKLRPGLKVEVLWSGAPKGEIADLKGVKPARA